MFSIGDLTFQTSSWSKTDWTKQCVGVSNCACDGVQQLADSKTQDRTLTLSNSEFVRFLAALDEL